MHRSGSGRPTRQEAREFLNSGCAKDWRMPWGVFAAPASPSPCFANSLPPVDEKSPPVVGGLK